ncbi:MAG: hypothetical protein AAF734_12435 [Bacteroidota bacterium]
MHWLLHIYRYIRVLSIDVALGAGVMAYFFGYYTQVTIPWIEYGILGLTVWLIYTADHLMDAYRITHTAHTYRHFFHQLYFEIILVVAVFILLLTAWLTWMYLPSLTFRYGLLVSGLVLLHFGLAAIDRLQHWLIFHKETRTALVYTLGVSLPAFSKSAVSLGALLLSAPFLLVFLVAYSNLLLISFFERSSDEEDNQVSLARKLGEYQLTQLILIVFFLQACIILYGIWQGIPFALLLLIGLMTVTLAIILHYKRTFKYHESYRALADAVFFYPCILFWL